MRPKILHLIDELRLGGAQTHLLTLIREARRSYAVDHVVVSLFGGGGIEDSLRELGIEVRLLELGELARTRSYSRMFGRIKAEIAGISPSLVEAHLTWSRLVGLPAAWRAGVKTRFAFEHGDIYFNSWKWRIWNFVGQFFARSILVCSQALGDWVRQTHGVFKRRLHVEYNCVDPSWATVPESQKLNRAALGLSPSSTWFAAVGTLGRGVNKRVDVCIRAIAEARAQNEDVGLVICGDGDQRSELEALAAALGIAESVKFLGMRRDVSAVLELCQGLCHAAPFEPFGIVCIEAMLKGLPVIVPSSGGIAEIVREGRFGRVYAPCDHRALAAHLVELHRRPELREAMGTEARQVALSRFGVHDYVKRVYELYGLQERRIPG